MVNPATRSSRVDNDGAALRDRWQGPGTVARWVQRSGRFLMTTARLGVLMLSPSSFRGSTRAAIALHVWRGMVRHLAGFLLLSLLLSAVLIRIVLVTSQSYGLSEFALDAMVRMLVLELIPLLSALFVAIRITLPAGAELRRMQVRGDFAALRRQGIEPLAREALPRAVAGLFALPALAITAALVALVLCYLMLYGPTPWAFDGFTRAVGKIFEPAVATIFGLKMVVFGIVVSLIPTASATLEHPVPRSSADLALQSLVHMSALLLLAEMLSLVGSYY